jgi:hypothetical protein
VDGANSGAELEAQIETLAWEAEVFNIPPVHIPGYNWWSRHLLLQPGVFLEEFGELQDLIRYFGSRDDDPQSPQTRLQQVKRGGVIVPGVIDFYVKIGVESNRVLRKHSDTARSLGGAAIHFETDGQPSVTE